jgi:TatD DNase family protein
MNSLSYIDVHSHIAFPVFDADRENILARMKENRVGAITVGVDLASSERAVALALTVPEIYATVGLHPNDSPQEGFNPQAFEQLLAMGKVVAVGECGLDYFRRDGTEQRERDRQHRQFEAQIQFAIKHNLPLMIHGRPSKGSMDAYQDIIRLLQHYKQEAGEKLRGDIHFFTGDIPVARALLELGFMFSFTGVVTFAKDYDEVIRFLPLDSILSETDCPYVAPHPHRGKKSESTHVIHVVDALARIRGEDVAVVRKAIIANACRLFPSMVLSPA